MALGFGLDAEIPGDVQVVLIVAKQLGRLFGVAMGEMRPARESDERIDGFLADKPTRPHLEKALIQVLVALAMADEGRGKQED